MDQLAPTPTTSYYPIGGACEQMAFFISIEAFEWRLTNILPKENDPRIHEQIKNKCVIMSQMFLKASYLCDAMVLQLRNDHTMNALANSNRLLREEMEGLVAKFDALEKQNEPMQRMSDNQMNRSKQAPEDDFIKLQQDVQDQQKTIQRKEAEIIRLKNEFAQKNQFQQQMINVRAEPHHRLQMDHLKNMSTERSRIQMQTAVEEMNKLSLENARMGSQVACPFQR